MAYVLSMLAGGPMQVYRARNPKKSLLWQIAHRHLLKRLCTLAHESLTEYLRTALGCPEGVPGIIMTLHTFGEYSILLNSAVDTREQVR